MSIQFDIAKQIIAETCPNRKLKLENIRLFANISNIALECPKQVLFPNQTFLRGQSLMCNHNTVHLIDTKSLQTITVQLKRLFRLCYFYKL